MTRNTGVWFWSSRLFYVAAVAAAAAASVVAALVDLDSALALVPLSIPVVPPVLSLLARHYRAWVVGASLTFQAGFAFAGGFTIGKLYWPSVLALLVGAGLEAVGALRRHLIATPQGAGLN